MVRFFLKTSQQLTLGLLLSILSIILKNVLACASLIQFNVSMFILKLNYFILLRIFLLKVFEVKYLSLIINGLFESEGLCRSSINISVTDEEYSVISAFSRIWDQLSVKQDRDRCVIPLMKSNHVDVNLLVDIVAGIQPDDQKGRVYH